MGFLSAKWGTEVGREGCFRDDFGCGCRGDVGGGREVKGSPIRK